MDLQEAGWGLGVDWSGSGQGQAANTCECGNKLLVSVNAGTLEELLGSQEGFCSTELVS